MAVAGRCLACPHIASTGPRPRGRGWALKTGLNRLADAASTGPRPRGRGWMCSITAATLIVLQRGRARAGADGNAEQVARTASSRFNGAAPARARMGLTSNLTECATWLQRGRARAGADGDRTERTATASHASTGPRPRGRGWATRDLGSSRASFNGAAPARARMERQMSRIGLGTGFNGAAPARARMVLICNSFWRRGAILCLRPPARIRLLLCSCCLIVHSLLAYYQVVTSCASASGVFRITSPLAG